MKITLNPITGSYASVTALNVLFQLIEDTLNDNVLWRDGFIGEPNSLDNDIDLAGYNILNVNNITSTGTPSIDASNVVVVPAGNISAVTAQLALEELDTEKASVVYVDAQDDLAIEHTDVSEAEGLIRKTGTGTYEGIKTKLDGTGAPTINDDTTAGYAVNSPWVDETNGDHYICVDNTTGAAVWIQSGTSNPGGVTSVGATAPVTSSGGATPTIGVDNTVALRDAINVFTEIQVTTKGVDVVSAASLALGSDGNYFDITGTTTITSIAPLSLGVVIKLHFDDALILTHHATDLILPGAANITTAAGDEAEFVEYAAGDWRCVNYQRAASIGSVLNTKVIDIGDWDMDTDIQTGINHGLTAANIRSVTVLIRSDGGANLFSLPSMQTSGTTDEYFNISVTSILLYRSTGGFFDSVNYDQTSFNRGWVTIQYVD